MKNRYPQWKQELCRMLAEKLVSALSDMTETELRIMRGELSRLEVSHAFEHEGTRQAIRLLIYVIGSLIFRI